MKHGVDCWLDQVNTGPLPLSLSLIQAKIVLVADGQRANTVNVTFVEFLAE